MGAIRASPPVRPYSGGGNDPDGKKKRRKAGQALLGERDGPCAQARRPSTGTSGRKVEASKTSQKTGERTGGKDRA